MKIWSLFKHENLTTGYKILWKRGEIAPKEQFLLFSTIFSIYFQLQESNYIYICKMWLFDLFFHNSANLICRSTDISKYFRESLGIRDNESQLYLDVYLFDSRSCTIQTSFTDFLNLFTLSGLFYHYSLDQSISSSRVSHRLAPVSSDKIFFSYNLFNNSLK